MNHMNMLTMEFATVAEAPNYKTGENGGEGFKELKLQKAIIVRKGTVSGNDTIDLQLVGEDGQKYVAMITARLLAMVTSQTVHHHED